MPSAKGGRRGSAEEHQSPDTHFPLARQGSEYCYLAVVGLIALVSIALDRLLVALLL
jgi:hypothetical protein